MNVRPFIEGIVSDGAPGIGTIKKAAGAVFDLVEAGIADLRGAGKTATTLGEGPQSIVSLEGPHSLVGLPRVDLIAAEAKPSSFFDDFFGGDFFRHDATGEHHSAVTIAERSPVQELLPKFEPLKILDREATDTPPRTMSPPAYKVLHHDGASFADERFVYPLPKKDASGAWVPSPWIEPGSSDRVSFIHGLIDNAGTGNGGKGIYVTSTPIWWKAGERGMTTFEVEIGGEGKTAWENGTIHRLDYAAPRIRLLRPLSPTEVNRLPF